MKFSAFIVLACILSTIILSGCSVKEKRDLCPCRLFLDFRSVDISDQAPFLICVVSDDGFEYLRTITSNEFQDTIVIDVPRMVLNVMVWSGGYEYVDEQGLIIPVGNECPPIYFHSSRIDADGEAVYDVVLLKKNYCILNISIDNPDEVEGMWIRGEVDGYDRIGNPHNGEFYICSQTDSTKFRTGRFYIPRQDDDTVLYLYVMESDGMVKTFPLHDYIAAFGYDWKKQELNDLNMHLNYTPAGVLVSVKIWDEECVIDVVI